ncbi:MAG: nucleoside hydrolase, partial [Planctomycetota bacterium]
MMRSGSTRISKTLLLTLFVFLPLLSDRGLGHDEKSLPVLIDTDMGLDDVRALYALLASESLDIHGLITVEGSASIGKGTDNLMGLLETNNMPIPDLYMGAAATGLEAPPWRSAANRLSGLGFPPPRTIRPVEEPYAKLRQLISTHYQKLHYLALGPLGNLARMESQYP